MKTFGRLLGIGSLALSLVSLTACSGDVETPKTPGTGAQNPAPNGATQDKPDAATAAPADASAATGVTSISAKVMVPADFQGEAVKIIFGWGDKQILDETGKLKNVPEQFLPNISGIANPKLTPGQAYDLELSGISIPYGEHYVLVAVYVKGTAGTIPQKDKDYVAGSLTTLSFNEAKVTMPPMELKKSQGVGM